MRSGKRYNFGQVVLAEMQFTDSQETKTRPVLVLFEEYGNVIVVGITSNPNMKGISITREEGLAFNSIIKMNYIMTITEDMIKKTLLVLSEQKKDKVKSELLKRIK